MGRDNFMMDVENEILREWGSQNFPKGKTRACDEAWAAHVKACLAAWYGGGKPPVSRREEGRDEVSWAEYVAWVEEGGGDDWFVASE